MTKYKFSFICVVLIIVSISTFSQSFKQFSGKPEEFSKELKIFTSNISEDEQKAAIDSFVTRWDSAKISPIKKQFILNFSKCFIDKKARPYPDYYNYIKAINKFIETKHIDTSFSTWLFGMSETCAKKKTSLTFLNRIVDHTNNLLHTNIIYKSPSIVWQPTSSSYSFKYDNGLKTVFDKTNLICFAKHDSIIIFNTKGFVDISNQTWIGHSGMVTWERAGYSRDTISALLTNYSIELSKTMYKADSVIFTNKLYFKEQILGQLEDNVMFITNKELSQYPKFESYKKEFFIPNIYTNVDYRGGFSMQGAKLVGAGSLEEPATLLFFRHDTLKMKASSIMFTFRQTKVSSHDASVTIYLDLDSIYHGDLQLSYNIRKKELMLNKSDNYTAQSPYLNSYHQVDMNFEQLRWRIDEPLILFTTSQGAAIGRALFESLNFFNYQEFTDLQFYDERHPLVALKKFSEYYNNDRVLSAKDFANFIHRPMDQVHTLLFPLAIKGYIFYNSATEMIELKDRLFDALKASIGRTDYDVLRFVSKTNAPLENASLDLRNNDLHVYGIPQIFVSDSQNVAMIPKDETIILKRNRNFQFDGIVSAGLFKHYGKNFFFNYDEFRIVLNSVDSIELKVIVGYDNFSKPIYQAVNNVIADVTGDILIDKPDNKSGIKSYPEYPIFSSRGNSYVYYDYPKIFNSVYKRDRQFFFKIDPFILDSLDNFTKEGMKFSGSFSSASIIPVMDETLVLQEDFSLGFTRKSSSDGFALFGNKGQFYETINLSNRGLRGNGKVKYITSTTKAEDILFFPDSANTLAQDFMIAAKSTATEYPQLAGNKIKIHWEPYKDKMFATNTDKVFQIYNNETSFNGQLALTPKSLSGNGTIDLTTANSTSNAFLLSYQKIDADTSEFNLRSLHTAGYTVLTRNVKLHIDLGARIGTFKSNDPQTITEFPENKYIAQLDEFKWLMDKKELAMISSRKNEASQDGAALGFKNEPLIGSKYISVKQGQDSLSFISPLAVYDYNQNLIKASKVKYLDIADARIFPDKENIVVEGGAVIRTLHMAKVLANRETRYHTIYNSNINILGKYAYGGNGKYDYITEANKIETITFSEITTDSLKHTIATGTIVEPDSFTFSPNFGYQGKVELTAANKYLFYNGAMHIMENCPNYSTSWFEFESTIEPLNIKIPVAEKLEEINDKKIVLGTLITTDSIHVYSSFFGERKNHLDTTMARAEGFLKYNKNNFTYEIGTEEKLKNRDLPGQLVSLNRKTCVHHDEGKIKLGVTYGQFKLTNAGLIDHDLKTNLVKLRISMALDFYFNDQSIKRMTYIVDSLGTNKIDITQPYYKENFGNFIEPDKLNKFYDEISLLGTPKQTPDIFNKTIFIDDVNLVWDDVTNSFRSVGKIGIGYIGGKPIHKYFEGYVEVWRKRSGDLFDLYLQVDGKTYYYFGYTRGMMQVASSDKLFEDPIRPLSDKQRSVVVGRMQTPYSYILSTERKVMLVKKRWKTGATEELEQIDRESINEENMMLTPVDSLNQNQPVDTINLNQPVDSIAPAIEPNK